MPNFSEPIMPSSAQSASLTNLPGLVSRVNKASEKPNEVNKFNPKKLLNSKWTALNPQNKERHFIVVKLLEDPQIEGKIIACILQSVMHKNDYEMPCEGLKDALTWAQGWK